MARLSLDMFCQLRFWSPSKKYATRRADTFVIWMWLWINAWMRSCETSSSVGIYLCVLVDLPGSCLVFCELYILCCDADTPSWTGILFQAVFATFKLCSSFLHFSVRRDTLLKLLPYIHEPPLERSPWGQGSKGMHRCWCPLSKTMLTT